MLAASLSMAAAIGTGISWFLLGCLVFGPGVGILTLVYLAITSDTNGTNSQPTEFAKTELRHTGLSTQPGNATPIAATSS